MALGDVRLKGEAESYVFNFGTNAACRVEEATGKTYGEVIAALNVTHPSVSLIRSFLKACLVNPANASDEQVGHMIDDIGGWEMVQAAVLLTPTRERSRTTEEVPA